MLKKEDSDIKIGYLQGVKSDYETYSIDIKQTCEKNTIERSFSPS